MSTRHRIAMLGLTLLLGILLGMANNRAVLAAVTVVLLLGAWAWVIREVVVRSKSQRILLGNFVIMFAWTIETVTYYFVENRSVWWQVTSLAVTVVGAALILGEEEAWTKCASPNERMVRSDVGFGRTGKSHERPETAIFYGKSIWQLFHKPRTHSLLLISTIARAPSLTSHCR